MNVRRQVIGRDHEALSEKGLTLSGHAWLSEIFACPPKGQLLFGQSLASLGGQNESRVGSGARYCLGPV